MADNASNQELITSI